MSYVRNKPSISSEAAAVLIAAARAKADELGVAMSIAVVDESGDLKAFDRMDGSVHVSIQLAQDKAFTAIGFGLSSDGWYDFIKDDGPLALGAPAAIDRLVTFGGGYPVVLDGAIVGGIGVSGGHYSQDMTVAQAGLAALGD
ncbi:heme-binding protein [Cryptosporangium sp. NPDC048952]|uniref:GlcG/HbpS family heme-binding protein n=1 Tax=Cryptosporangium sp. NPDC048952 TaxID=3363961 RepID=UPI0037147E13